MAEETQADRIERKLDMLIAEFERFKPILDRYHMAASSGNALIARRLIKGRK